MKIELLAFPLIFAILSAVCAKPSTSEMKPNTEITAADFVRNIKIGWNLGNSLDTADLTWLPANPTVTQMETGWGNPVTAKANITAVKNAGFNTVRIPVSWAKAVDSNYNIRADWMARVTEVVNYAVDNDMYIIINTHHDESVFKFMNSNTDSSLAAFKKIWEQIADNFKNYNEKLIFEGLNEPRTIGSANEWTGGTPEERANLNKYHQVFVDTVRAGVGNNASRILMIPTYGTSTNQAAMNALVIPNDSAQNKIIVSIHIYDPYDFAGNPNGTTIWDITKPADRQAVTGPIDRAYNTFVSKGIPVIIGEFGAMDKNNEAARAGWAQYFVSYAKSKGIPCFWWDDGGNLRLLNRQNNNFFFPQIINGIMEGAE